MDLRNGLGLSVKLGGGIIGAILLLSIYGILGAISAGTTAAVLAAALLFLGFVDMGTAQAIFLGVMAAGGILTVLTGIGQLLLVTLTGP